MTAPDRLLDIGRVVKPHGLRGELVVEAWSDQPGRLSPGAELETDRGVLRVVRARPFADRMLVVFEGVDDREGAEALRDVVLRAQPIDVPGALWVHELVLDGGRLVPLRFVTEHQAGERVVVDVPAGLFE